MEDSAFEIDEQNITFENLMNIASGRISCPRLKKILSKQDPLEVPVESEESENSEDEMSSSEKEFHIFPFVTVTKVTIIKVLTTWQNFSYSIDTRK